MSVRYRNQFNRYLVLSLCLHSLLALGILQYMTTATPGLGRPTPVSVALAAPAVATITPHRNQMRRQHQLTQVSAQLWPASQPVARSLADVTATVAPASRPGLESANTPLPHRAPPTRRMPVQRLSAPAAKTLPTVPKLAKVKPQRTGSTTTQAVVPASRPAPSITAYASPSDANRSRRLAAGQITGKQLPQFVYKPKPNYPFIARRRGWQGTVMLHIEMLPNGTVGQVKVATSSGYAPLDAAAQKAVRKWRHRPLQHNGSPITRQANLPIHFRLD